MEWVAKLTKDGFARVTSVVTEREISSLVRFFQGGQATHRRRGAVFADRSALNHKRIRRIAADPKIIVLAQAVLGPQTFAVRAIYFDKVEGANWAVPWHQDLTISVRERKDAEWYGPWSIKEATHHVQPPTSILENMVSVRLHLDPCGEGNGPLRVIAGSHAAGKLSHQMIDSLVSDEAHVVCFCDAGDALLMRPLLLHASSPADRPEHRRVLHIDYASCQLEGGLEWQHRVGRLVTATGTT